MLSEAHLAAELLDRVLKGQDVVKEWALQRLPQVS